jgi:3-oxoacyl-[acyl-carrier protein] reductase
MENSINNKKRLLILGGSSDIGVELAKFFLSKGWHVTVHYSGKNLVFKEKLIRYQNISFIKLNFKNLSEKDIDKKIKVFSKNNYHSVVNLIGFLKNNKFLDLKYKDINESFKINTFIPILIQKNIMKQMIKNKWGRILNCSSIGIKFGGGENTFAYSFSKYAIEFIPSIYKRLAKDGVFINNLRIGVTNTKIHRKDKSKNMKKRISLIPIKRMATPIEIAKYIYQLSSSENTFVTGETFTVAGGE